MTPIEYRSDQPFDSLDDACEFWMTYMGLDGDESRTFLQAFLGARLRREGDGLVARLRERAAVLWWRV